MVDECLLSPRKELVIEGFPRSANTFAVVAFRQAQGRQVPMAHHLHVEAQVLRGVRRGLPVVVLIRRPIEALRSLLIRHREIGFGWAVERYIQFYKAVQHVEKEVVIASFGEVTEDFGAVIERVNHVFGTSYTRFEHSTENVQRVYAEIEQINRALTGGKETHVARPSPAREGLKAGLGIDEPHPRLQRATDLYLTLTENRG